MRTRFWLKKPDPGLCTSNDGRFSQVYNTNILDNFQSLLFCFHTFSVRRRYHICARFRKPARIRIRSNSDRIRGSRANRGRLPPKVWKQKRKFLKLSKYSTNKSLKICLGLKCRAPDPFFGQTESSSLPTIVWKESITAREMSIFE